MARFLPMLTTITAVAAALALPTLPAHAAGSFDGNWVISADAAGGAITAEGQFTCPAIRIPITVTDGKVNGMLHRTQDNTVVAGPGAGASPVTGTVGNDGAVQVNWGPFHVRGKLSGNGGSVSWNGECGPRTGTANKL